MSYTRPTKEIFSIGWGIVPDEPRFVCQIGTRGGNGKKISEIIENDLNIENYGVEYEVYHSDDGTKENQSLHIRYLRKPDFIKYNENDTLVRL